MLFLSLKDKENIIFSFIDRKKIFIYLSKIKKKSN